MAMALHATVKPVYLRGNNFFLVIARLTASGSYAGTLGDPMDLAVLARTSKKQPVAVIVNSESGFIYKYDLANKTVRVYQATTTGTNLPLAQHSTAAFVAGVTADIITAWILFK